MNLPEQFTERMKKRLGKDFPAFLASYERPPERALRVNVFKLSPEEFLSRAPFPLEERVPWEERAFYIRAAGTGADVYHFAGLYYMQEPSAMCAAPLLGVKRGERVLDLCAAPGGKTGQLAADLAGTGVLIANEIEFHRAKILAQNVERLGIPNCAVTSASPAQLKERFLAYFDKILVDAPCSGEGMFKKEENAIPEWSPGNVERCAVRQREILDAAAEMLADGGRLVYSTCTFSEEEDEWQVASFLKEYPAFSLIEMKKIYPHEERGEGHFAALFEKSCASASLGAPSSECPPASLGAPLRGSCHVVTEGVYSSIKPFPVKRNAQAEKAFRAFAEDFFTEPPPGTLHTLPDGRMYLVPADMPDLSGLSLLRLGVEAGSWDGKLFKPAHALAMAYGTDARRKVHLSREEARKYLRGDTLDADLGGGWCVVCVEEFPLGLGKSVNGVVKNHLPKALRLFSTVMSSSVETSLP